MDINLNKLSKLTDKFTGLSYSERVSVIEDSTTRVEGELLDDVIKSCCDNHATIGAYFSRLYETTDVYILQLSDVETNLLLEIINVLKNKVISDELNIMNSKAIVITAILDGEQYPIVSIVNCGNVDSNQSILISLNACAIEASYDSISPNHSETFKLKNGSNHFIPDSIVTNAGLITVCVFAIGLIAISYKKYI